MPTFKFDTSIQLKKRQIVRTNVTETGNASLKYKKNRIHLQKSTSFLLIDFGAEWVKKKKITSRATLADMTTHSLKRFQIFLFD